MGYLDLSFICYYAHPYLLSIKVFVVRITTVICLEECRLEICNINIDIHLCDW